MKNIILIGYRGTGKTSVGRKLAEKMKLPFYDTDQLLTDRIGKTIKAWVEEKGWASFREEEKKVIQEISAQAPGIVSLGGGAVMDPENCKTIRQMGRIIWLTAGLQTILERMKSDPLNQDNRPALSDQDWENEAKDLLLKRSPVYRQLADFSIDTEGKTVETIAEELVPLIKRQGMGETMDLKQKKTISI
jgi:shikimate kinase